MAIFNTKKIGGFVRTGNERRCTVCHRVLVHGGIKLQHFMTQSPEGWDFCSHVCFQNDQGRMNGAI